MSDNVTFYPNRFVARYDNDQDVFQVVDMWNGDIQELCDTNPEEEIPMDHLASITIPYLAAKAVVAEVEKMENAKTPHKMEDRQSASNTMDMVNSIVPRLEHVVESDIPANKKEILAEIVKALSKIGQKLSNDL